jgi:hypothetical protein
MCKICDELSIGETLLSHYYETSCKDSEKRLLFVGILSVDMINKGEDRESEGSLSSNQSTG